MGILQIELDIHQKKKFLDALEKFYFYTLLNHIICGNVNTDTNLKRINKTNQRHFSVEL